MAWLGKYRWRETFSWRPATPAALFAAALLGIGLAPWMQLVGTIQAKWFPPNLEHQMDLLRRILPILERHPFLLPLLIGTVAGICEETLFRGPIQNGLLRKISTWPAIFIAGFMFAAAHLDLFGLPVRMFLGVLLGWLVVHTGSVFPAMVMHAAYDIAQLLSISLETNRLGATKVIDQATTSQGTQLSPWMLGAGAVAIMAASLMLRRAKRPGGPDDPAGPAVTTPPAAAYSPPPPMS
jgi:membrane protease YdiL (CAAX protease family)